jgi:hypothetical protein
VVAADVGGVPLRDVGDGPGHHVGDQPEARPGREDVGAAGEVLLDDVVLRGPGELADDLVPVGRLLLGLLLGEFHVEREEPHGGGVDGHRGVGAGERDAVEQLPHVTDVADGHADLADLGTGKLVIGVVPGLGGKVEGDGEPGLPLLQVAAVEPVGRGRG